MRTVSAREANQQFARILGEAANGEEIVITRGKPVAVLAPYRQAPLTPEQEAALERLVGMMRRGLVNEGEDPLVTRCTSDDGRLLTPKFSSTRSTPPPDPDIRLRGC